MILILHNGGHEDTRINPYLQRASQFYAEHLFTPQLLKHIVVTLKFNKHLDALGYTSVEARNTRGSARSFLIEIHPYMSAKELLLTFAHEMVHVKHYALGELNDAQTLWKGKELAPDELDYYDLPWEIDANGIEAGLFARFVTAEALWNVFKNIRNPDADLEPEDLGWLSELTKSKRPKIASLENVIVSAVNTAIKNHTINDSSD